MPADRKNLLFHLYRVIIQKIKYPGLAQLVARVVWDHQAGSSSLPSRTTSERNPLHSVSRRSLLGAALKLRSAPLLLLSNSNPLRWASSWFWVRDDGLHLFYQHMTAQKFPPPFRFRLRRKLHSGGDFFAFHRDSLRWTRGGKETGDAGWSLHLFCQEFTKAL